jgi:hypothetical protein
MAQGCSCGFARLDDEEVIDHLLALFTPADSRGSDGQVHMEGRGALACFCGVTPTKAAEMDQHFLEMFTPTDSIGRDGKQHVAAAQ